MLLFAPPGSAKSTYVSILFPSYYLARFPSNSILAATHSVEFAQRWGRRVRNDIAAHAQMLGIELAADSQASDRWALTTGGEYYGVGAGVGISGFRADLGIGDDFFGSREDAWSATVREKRWEWYRDDFSARLKPGAKRVIMNTRWHEEDVAGRVLEQIRCGIVRGRVISIPAIAEENDILGRKPGEYLWDEPEGYNYGEFLRARQRESIPMMWSALYQQRPTPEEGDYFKAAWLRPCVNTPALETLAVYGASDYAVTADGGDYTVHIVVGIDPAGPHVRARSMAQAGLLGRMGRCVLQSCAAMEAQGVGRGAGPDQGWCRTIPGADAAGAQRLRLSSSVSDARRQGRAGAIHPRAHGARRLVCAAERRMATSSASRAPVFPGRQVTTTRSMRSG